MYKCLILLLLPCLLIAQESTEIEKDPHQKYVSLEDNKVYDVEIIVFAYQHPLPNDKTYTNKVIVDDSIAIDLTIKPEDMPYVQMNLINNDENPEESLIEKEDYIVPLDDSKSNQQALAWFNHNEEDFKLKTIWDKLTKQPNIIPLIHRSWRQTETPFQEPTYVNIINIIPENELPIEVNSFNDNSTLIDESLLEDDILPGEPEILNDFTLTGMVALSKGRFMHFENNLNLYRVLKDQDGDSVQNMIFSLDEKKQVKVDELNYFDSPWMGSIVKITEYNEDSIEELTEEESNDE
jgi:hypothetical protein